MGISKADFDYVRHIVRSEAAIMLDDNKEYLVEMRLGTLAQSEGIQGVTELIADVRRSNNVELKDLMVEAMTTNETSFFRDRHPFDAMTNLVIPEMIEKRAGEQRLNLWCAAASTGQEPYSLAIILREAMQAKPHWNVNILGTDISPEVLKKAEDGVYSQHEVGRGLPATKLVKNFDHVGLHWHAKEELKAMLEFRRLNLIGSWQGLPTFDVIFIRNVLIYFEPKIKQQILANASKLLAKDGYLFLGGSETTLGLNSNLKRVELGPVSAYQHP